MRQLNCAIEMRERVKLPIIFLHLIKQYANETFRIKNGKDWDGIDDFNFRIGWRFTFRRLDLF